MSFAMLALLAIIVGGAAVVPTGSEHAATMPEHAATPSEHALLDGGATKPAAKVVLERTVPRLVVGQQVGLRAYVQSDSGQRLDIPIMWRATSSSYVSLAADGRITGIRPGRVTIIALAGDASARFDVQVIENRLGWLTITPDRLHVRVGEAVRFRYEALDRSGASVSGLSPTWSLAPGPGTVSDDGEFVALAAGTHTVYAHIADHVASATVTVAVRN